MQVDARKLISNAAVKLRMAGLNICDMNSFALVAETSDNSECRFSVFKYSVHSKKIIKINIPFITCKLTDYFIVGLTPDLTKGLSKESVFSAYKDQDLLGRYRRIATSGALAMENDPVFRIHNHGSINTLINYKGKKFSLVALEKNLGLPKLTAVMGLDNLIYLHKFDYIPSFISDRPKEKKVYAVLTVDFDCHKLDSPTNLLIDEKYHEL